MKEKNRKPDISCNLKRIVDDRKGTANEISIRQLAEKSGLKFETVRRLYHDKTVQYHRKSLAAVCVTLGIEIDELLTLYKADK